MPRPHSVQLSDEQRSQLERLIRSGKSAARVQTRARILLLADAGESTAAIARALLISDGTVQRIRKCFAQEGMDSALYDKPRPGRPPRITGEIEAQLVLLACSQPPQGHNRWTLQLLADQLVALGHIDRISDVAVYKRLKKTNLSLG